MSSENMLTAAEAAAVLGVEPSRVEAMAEEGLLTPVGDGPDRRFAENEVRAVHNLGG